MSFRFLRSSIQDLANRKGAYIIVSSLGSVSDSSLRRRRAAMAKAVEGTPNAGKLTLDFYDRTRIATWVRSHQGLILWVKKQIGKTVQGWEPYGAMGISTGGANAEFLLDEKLRIYNGESAGSGEGINLSLPFKQCATYFVNRVGWSVWSGIRASEKHVWYRPCLIHE